MHAPSKTGPTLAGAERLGYAFSRNNGTLVDGASRALAVEGDSKPPKDADVVVIGAGNIGCFTALTLAERGMNVVLCEKGVVAGEASGRSLGYIDSLFLDPTKMEIIHRSKILWESVKERLGGDVGYRRTGVALLCANEESLAGASGWVESVRGMPGVEARVIDAKEAKAVAKGCETDLVGGILEPTDAVADPALVSPLVAKKFRERGGVLLQQCAVRGIEMSGGRVSGVVTEKGAINCPIVILAGGAWSPLFARSLGLDLPQFMASAYIMRLSEVPGPDVALIHEASGIVMRPRFDGGYDVCKGIGFSPVTPQLLLNLPRLRPAMKNLGATVKPVFNLGTFFDQCKLPRNWKLDTQTPFEERRILAPGLDKKHIGVVLEDACAAFAPLQQTDITEIWGGVMSSTLDNMPYISPIDQYPGLIVGSGFYYGLTMAPAAGEALADLASGLTPAMDLNLYRFSRFSDGTPIVFRA